MPRQTLLSAESAARRASTPTSWFSRTRRPGRRCIGRAEEQGCDLIVVGSCSRGLLGRVMLGDDTRGALNGAPCAVAIAARGYGESPVALATVGVAYNGSEESRAALALAQELAAPSACRGSRRWKWSRSPRYAFTGLVAPAVGEIVELMLSEGNARMSELQGVEGRAVYGVPGRGARGLRRRARPAPRRLAQLRPRAPSRARQHIRSPRAPCPLLAARAAQGRRRGRPRCLIWALCPAGRAAAPAGATVMR